MMQFPSRVWQAFLMLNEAVFVVGSVLVICSPRVSFILPLLVVSKKAIHGLFLAFMIGSDGLCRQVITHNASYSNSISRLIVGRVDGCSV